MSTTEIISDPAQITIPDVDKVVRSYAGKIGCACGCIGNYSESSRSKAIVRGKMVKLMELADDSVQWMSCDQFVSAENYETGRAYTLYLS